MGRTIAIANQKGGVGKTTTSINLSASLAAKGKKVLMIDTDPQGNATSGFGIDKNDLEDTIYELILGECSVQDCIIKDVIPGVSVLPSNVNLAAAEIELIGVDKKEYILKKEIDWVKDSYDFIIIDCPPSLSMLTVNALAVANSVVIPVQAQYLSAKGLEQLLGTIAKVRRQINPKLTIEGILLTMVDNRTNYAKEISGIIRETYGHRLRIFNTEIPRSVRAEEMSAEGKSIFAHDPKGKVAAAYRELTKEVCAIERKKQHQLEAAR